METNNKIKIVKEFDAVKMMREIRDKINVETKDMTFEELRKYIDSKLNSKKRLVGQ
jgi:hypothetical protein